MTDTSVRFSEVSSVTRARKVANQFSSASHGGSRMSRGPKTTARHPATDVGAVTSAIRGSSGPSSSTCLLYTSDAADDLLCVDLGGRRIIKKKKKEHNTVSPTPYNRN